MLASLKISYLEQLNCKILASLSTSFPCLKIALSIKRIGIKKPAASAGLKSFNLLMD